MSIVILASCTLDVNLFVDHLPVRCEDVKVLRRQSRLGGCGYHVAKACPGSILFCPIGEGRIADLIRKALKAERFEKIMPEVSEDNGICYCLIEPDGQRTFLASHGAEYRYTPEMMDRLPEAGWIYVSGIDLEENRFIPGMFSTLDAIPFFSPGPRLHAIPDVLEAMLENRAVLHMNEDELKEWTGKELEEGMKTLYARTHRMVIVTAAEKGSYAYDGRLHFQPSLPVRVKNATGAGDTHAGACLFALSRGIDPEPMLKTANETALKKIRDV